MKKTKKLSLTTTTISTLTSDHLTHVVAGSVSVYNPSGVSLTPSTSVYNPSGGITSLNPSGGITSLNPSGGRH